MIKVKQEKKLVKLREAILDFLDEKGWPLDDKISNLLDQVDGKLSDSNFFNTLKEIFEWFLEHKIIKTKGRKKTHETFKKK